MPASLHLIDALTQIASLYVVASTDAGGRMHNDGKSPNLGVLPTRPTAHPTTRNSPPKKNSANAHVLEEIGHRRVAPSHPYGMRRLPMLRGGHSTSARGRTNGLMVGFWRHSICNNSPPR